MSQPEAESRAERVPSGVVLALVGGLLAFAFAPILVRHASEAPGVAVAVWRTVFAAILLAPVAVWRSGSALRRLSRRDLALISAAGVLLGLHFVLWIESIYWTSVASASVLVTTSPLFIAVLGFLLLGERLTRRTVLAIGIGVAGASLIALADRQAGVFPHAAFGNGLALGASVLVSGYLLIGRAVRQRLDLLVYLCPLYVCAALTTLGVALVRGVALDQPPTVLLFCFLLALGPQLLGHGAFNLALRFIPAALLGLLTLIEPVLASLLAFSLFGEMPSPLALAGMAIVLASLAIACLRSNESS